MERIEHRQGSDSAKLQTQKLVEDSETRCKCRNVQKRSKCQSPCSHTCGTATHCNTLQHTATHCNTPQFNTRIQKLRFDRLLYICERTIWKHSFQGGTCFPMWLIILTFYAWRPRRGVEWLAVLQHTATQCRSTTMQYSNSNLAHSKRGVERLEHCNTLQHTAT